MTTRKSPLTPLVRQKGRPPSADRTRPVALRGCKAHGIAEFALYGRKSPRWRCKRCVAEQVTRRKQKVRRILVAEAGGCCALCGYDRCIVSLVFHHVDPADKSFELGSSTTKALDIYRDEARKCVLLCANCHGEVEAGVVASPPAGACFEDVLYSTGPMPGVR